MIQKTEKLVLMIALDFRPTSYPTCFDFVDEILWRFVENNYEQIVGRGTSKNQRERKIEIMAPWKTLLDELRDLLYVSLLGKCWSLLTETVDYQVSLKRQSSIAISTILVMFEIKNNEYLKNLFREFLLSNYEEVLDIVTIIHRLTPA